MRFLAHHQQWCNERIGHNTEPAYTLPDSVVSALSTETEARGNNRASRRLIAEADERAERSFRETCQAFSSDTIGVWRDQPVQFPWLIPAENNLGFNDQNVSTLTPSGSTKERTRAALRQCQANLAAIRHQLLGYVGFLNCDDQFISERDRLKSQFESLPSDTPLPQSSAGLLSAPVASQLMPEYERMSDAHQLFYSSLRELIQRWYLTGFATWDLPLPQGPLDNAPVNLISRIRGPQTRVNYVPAFLSVPSNANLREELTDRQRHEAQAAGVNSEFPRTDISARHGESGAINLSSHETRFRIWLVHVTVFRRYGKIHGVKSRLNAALATELGISDQRVKKLCQDFVGMI